MLSRRELLASVGPALHAQQRRTGMFADAEAYERFMGRWSAMLAPLLVEFADPRGAGPILDVGSGTGALAFALTKSNPHCRVVGIDPSAEYIAYANSRNPFPDRARFEVGDAQQLRFPVGAFEHCLSLLVFNFIPNRQKALSELLLVTKPGGHIAAAVWDYGAGMQMLRVFWDAAVTVDPGAEKADERHMPLCRAGELKDLWKRGGLDRVEERPLDYKMPFASFADYWDPFLLGQGPAGAYVRKLDHGRQKVLRDEVKRRLKIGAEDAPFSLPARAWAVRGTVPAQQSK